MVGESEEKNNPHAITRYKLAVSEGARVKKKMKESKKAAAIRKVFFFSANISQFFVILIPIPFHLSIIHYRN
jgi:hypothetical protein